MDSLNKRIPYIVPEIVLIDDVWNVDESGVFGKHFLTKALQKDCSSVRVRRSQNNDSLSHLL